MGLEIIEKYYYPILSYSEKEKNSKESILAIWDEFDLLSEKNKEIVSSPETAKKIKLICEKNILDEGKSSILSRTIRNYYFNKISPIDFPQILSQEMEIDLEKAKEISNLVIQKIIDDKTLEKAYQAKLEKLTVSDAIKKYPEIGEQLITENYLNLKNFPNPVRPSLKNWISDYTFRAGFESHDSIIRGEYLFQSENTRKISSSEREKLSYIFRAYDEKSLIEINIVTKQIIFPKVETPRNPENISFSSPHKFPLEKQIEKKEMFSPAKTVQPLVITNEDFQKKEEFFRQKNNFSSKNIVNLKN